MQVRRLIVLLGGGALLAVAATAGGIAMAAGSSPTPTPATQPAHPPKLPGLRGELRFFGRGFGFGPGEALHGQVTVRKGGGYAIVDFQRGTVTSVDTSSSPETLTVKSVDGFVQTYDVPATTVIDAQRDGLGSIKVGDKVSVVATVPSSGTPPVAAGTPSATRITDITRLKAAGWFDRLPMQPPTQPQVPPAMAPGGPAV
jgi:hypothetical protein